jgi:hypothetical protein
VGVMGNGIGLAVRARHRDACTEWTYLHWNRHPHRLDSVRLRARGLEEPGSRSTVLAPHLLKNLLLPVAVLVLLACAYADSTVTGDPPRARCAAAGSGSGLEAAARIAACCDWTHAFDDGGVDDLRVGREPLCLSA